MCGTDCGSCQEPDQVCNAQGQCVDRCIPDCGDRQCGLDPVCRSLSCGDCALPGPWCNDGVCSGCSTSSFCLYVVPAITDEPVLPTTSISQDLVSDRISLVAASGEYEPASFVIGANTGSISSLLAEATDLTGDGGSIPASAVDIRVVKCWQVSGTTMPYRGTRTLAPELLLKDDTLIKVEGEENYVKLTAGDYVWISDPVPPTDPSPAVEDMPIRDSSTLLPVDIPAGTNKQFWVTVHVPENAAPGVYDGTIDLSTETDGPVAQLALELEVLPFDLLPSMMTHIVSHRGLLSSEGTISMDAKNVEQYQAELLDILAHSDTSTMAQPYYVGESTPIETYGEALSMRQAAGAPRDELFSSYFITDWGEYPSIEDVAAKAQEIMALAGGQVYFEGDDEAQGGALSIQRPVWEAIRSVGGKMWACGHRVGAGADVGEDNFSLMGDIQDVFVCARAPDAAEAAGWHGVGHEILCYANPMSGLEKPETYRRNYGLLLWQNDYDGGLAIYQWKGGLIWNDFDDPDNWRAHVFAYPTVNGVIDTTEWEGWREARDDIRYLTTLLDAVEKAKADGMDTSAAETWLAGLKTEDLGTQDLDAIRRQMIDFILSLAT